MKLHFRHDVPRHHEDSQIRHQKGIRPRFRQESQIVRQSFQIAVMGKGIDGDIYLLSKVMGKGNALCQILP